MNRTADVGSGIATIRRSDRHGRATTFPWLAQPAEAPAPPGRRLRALLARPGILSVPGAHDALSGLLAKRAGFECLYVSGAALSASMALPDLGLMTPEEVTGATRRLVRATGLPVIVDGDTGFGETLNVMRLVVELEQAGAAALQIEDQEVPKKCGHLPMKRLVPADDMARKVEAARRARRDLLVIARTDAAPEDVEEAYRRAKLYEEAGADIIFAEALVEDDDFRRFARGLEVPLLANMTEFGKTPYRSARDFEALGAKIVLWPVTSLRVAAKAVEALYAHLARNGEQESLLDRMQTRAALAEIIGYAGHEALDRAIAGESPKRAP